MGILGYIFVLDDAKLPKVILCRLQLDSGIHCFQTL